MKDCTLTITTTADGRENTVTYQGKMKLESSYADLRYVEEQSQVHIEIEGETVRIMRRGDYTLRLTLEKGKRHAGAIGIGGAEGEVFTKTDELTYSMKNNSLLLFLRYDLIVGGETQTMKLRLLAKQKK